MIFTAMKSGRLKLKKNNKKKLLFPAQLLFIA